MPSFSAGFAAALAALVVTVTSGRAQADGSLGLDGPYAQGQLHEKFTVQQWTSACGPAPSSTTSGGGEAITVRQDGPELVFTGGGRTFRTDQCYDPLPTLKVDVHTRDQDGTTWRNHCGTSASDPRRATIQSLVAVSGTQEIDVTETGRYEITLAEGTCIADIHRDRSFTRIGAAPARSAPVPASAPAAASVASGSCAHPGPPASLEVRPAKKSLRAGDTLVLRTTVRDAAGCVVGPTTALKFALESDDSGKLAVDDKGTVTVAGDAAETTTQVEVSAAGKSAAAEITVISGQRYDELLANGELDAGSDDAASQVSLVVPSELGGEGVRAKDESARRRAWFVAIIGGFAFALGILALIFHRRTRAAAALERRALERHEERVRDVENRRGHQRQAHAEQLHAHEESVERAERAQKDAARRGGGGGPGGKAGGAPAPVPSAELPPGNAPLACTTCRRDFPSRDQGGGVFCPFDATRLSVARPGPHASGSVCPTCHRGYPPGVRVCAVDGDELAPVPLVRPAALGARGKICPTCGARFEGAAAFCGKDGTSLVLLN